MTAPWNPHYPRPSEPVPVHSGSGACNGLYVCRLPSWGTVGFVIDDMGNLVEFNDQTAEHVAREYCVVP